LAFFRNPHAQAFNVPSMRRAISGRWRTPPGTRIISTERPHRNESLRRSLTGGRAPIVLLLQ